MFLKPEELELLLQALTELALWGGVIGSACFWLFNGIVDAVFDLLERRKVRKTAR